MVLHNNKWDRRAKHKYLKKHGLSASDVNRASDAADAKAPAAPGLEETAEDDAQASSPEGTETLVVPELPELDELDPELQRLYHERALAAHKPAKAPTIATADPSEIQRATAGVERSKMNKAVRERFGSSVAAKLRKSPLELDSDSDFDEFMDELDAHTQTSGSQQQAQQHAPSGKVEVNKDKQDFLDKLFR